MEQVTNPPNGAEPWIRLADLIKTEDGQLEAFLALLTTEERVLEDEIERAMTLLGPRVRRVSG